MKEIVLNGSPFERGFYYGSQCREEIATSIRSYTHLMMSRQNLSWEHAKKLALNFVDSIDAAGAHYLEEMRGIASGAQVDFEDILAINVRSELIYAPQEDKDECTAFSAVSPATADDGVVAGQNWDYIRAQREAVVILRIPAEGKMPAIFMVVEAGMIGAMGMNSAGISLTLNALSTPEGGSGLPLHVRMRKILEQSTFRDAFAVVVDGGQPAPANLIVTHKDGITMGFEIDPAGVDILQPVGGLLTHTNHFIGPRFALRSNSQRASTYVRLQRIRTRLEGKTGLGVEDFKSALCDHAGYPCSVCVHTDPELETSEPWQAATNFSLIMDLKAGIAYVAPGNPCQSVFHEYRV